MKLVTITRVKNEADVIEAFVRHHTKQFNKMVVLDDGSTDGTYEILKQLQSVNADLIVLRRASIGYLQQRDMSLLLHMAIEKLGADWIAPLDADEFVEADAGESLPQILAHEPSGLYRLAWTNFIWTPGLDKCGEPNPVVRQRFRLPPDAQYAKVLIPASLVSTTTELALGNHALVTDGTPVPALPLDRVRICHYPVRSVSQFATKVAIGHLQHLATPGWDGATGFQYIKPFQELCDFGLEGFEDRMVKDSLHYGRPESVAGNQVKAMEAPLSYLGGALELTREGGAVLPHLLQYNAFMARKYAEQAAELDRAAALSAEYASLRKRVSQLETELHRCKEPVRRRAHQLRSWTFSAFSRVHWMVMRAKETFKG